MEEREIHDPKRQLTLEKELSAPVDLDTDADVQMPWTRDGRSWHTVNHLDHQGMPAEWDPKMLLWLVETMESLGSFAPTDWNHRTRIELKAPGNCPWFSHILTGSKDLLEVAIRVGKGRFTARELRRKLQIKDLDDRPDLPIYGQWSRIRMRAASTGWEDVRLYLRDFKDVGKTDFRAFLKTAARDYFNQLEATEAEPEAARPWKTQGQQWHLSQRSIRQRHLVRWKPPLLLAMVGRFKSIQPDLSVDWNNQTAAHIIPANRKRWLGKIVTNIGRGLSIELRAPR